MKSLVSSCPSALITAPFPYYHHHHHHPSFNSSQYPPMNSVSHQTQRNQDSFFKQTKHSTGIPQNQHKHPLDINIMQAKNSSQIPANQTRRRPEISYGMTANHGSILQKQLTTPANPIEKVTVVSSTYRAFSSHQRSDVYTQNQPGYYSDCSEFRSIASCQNSDQRFLCSNRQSLENNAITYSSQKPVSPLSCSENKTPVYSNSPTYTHSENQNGVYPLSQTYSPSKNTNTVYSGSLNYNTSPKTLESMASKSNINDTQNSCDSSGTVLFENVKQKRYHLQNECTNHEIMTEFQSNFEKQFNDDNFRFDNNSDTISRTSRRDNSNSPNKEEHIDSPNDDKGIGHRYTNSTETDFKMTDEIKKEVVEDQLNDESSEIFDLSEVTDGQYDIVDQGDPSTTNNSNQSSSSPSRETDEDLAIEELTKPCSSSNTLFLPPCRICGAKASGFHYGVNSCEACKGFFRRALKRPMVFFCAKNNSCNVKGSKRSTCRFCRYKRCLSLGMSKDAIKTGRYSNKKRTKDIIEVKRLQNRNSNEMDYVELDDIIDRLLTSHESNIISSARTLDSYLYKKQKDYHYTFLMHEKIANSRVDKSSGNDSNSKLNAHSTAASTNSAKTKESSDAASSQKINKAQPDFHNNDPDSSRYSTMSPTLSSASTDSGFTSGDSGFLEDRESNYTASRIKLRRVLNEISLLNSNPAESTDGLDNSAEIGLDNGAGVEGNTSNDSCTKSSSFCESGSACGSSSLISLKRKSDCFNKNDEEDDEAEGVALKKKACYCPTSHDVDSACQGDSKTALKGMQCVEVVINLKRIDSLLQTGSDSTKCSFNIKDKLGETQANSNGRRSSQDVSSCITDVKDYDEESDKSDSVDKDSSIESGVDSTHLTENVGNDVKAMTVSEVDACTKQNGDAKQKSKPLPDVKPHLTNKNGHVDHLQNAQKWVTGYVNFARSIPGFESLPAHDQAAVLRHAWDEVWILGAYRGFNSELGVAVMPSGRCFQLKEMERAWGQSYARLAFDVADILKTSNLTHEILVLLKAICIISPGRCDLELQSKAEESHWLLVRCLINHLDSSVSKEVMTFPRLVSILTSLRNLSELAQTHLSQRFLGLNSDKPGMELSVDSVTPF